MATILLVDDAPVDRRLFGTLLEQNGDYRVRYAEDGRAALQSLAQGLPDLVVTDMQMPKMDGLELVTAIRCRYPQLPVVLLTGKGSETLATRALQKGAAGYVPKSDGGELLLQTVDHVLFLARPAADFQRLVNRAGQMEFRIDLPNEGAAIAALVAVVQNLIESLGICDANGRLQVGVALEHALLNAMYHGNLELTVSELPNEGGGCGGGYPPSIVGQRMAEPSYGGRKISVTVRMQRDEAQFVVSDEGPGFNVQEFSEVGLSKAAFQSRRRGQGLFLMWAFMDRVSFNRVGNKVTLIKRRQAIPSESQPTPSATFEKDRKRYPERNEAMGQLVPPGGGTTLPLTKRRLIIGRDPSCDIILTHSDISHHHCLLHVFRGWWFVKDLDSKNGVRVNRVLTHHSRIAPGSVLTIGKNSFELRYQPYKLGAEGITPPDDPF